ncbi:MAG: hypothetical protein EA403_06690 [Spirochaetaceae bacterium]|nr:MAG: hypothetical protein EA403_06690 [Spirochaetaceae bacterium]
MNRFHVPANILLVGEYAVIEPGGLGVAAAVEPSVTVTIEPDAQFLIRGITGHDERSWSPESGGDPFLETAARTAIDQLAAGRLAAPARITIDSTAFFDREGNKLGFGSSASVVVGLVRALCVAYRVAPRNLAQIAVRVHRAVQNGRGSGYDVAASRYGGVGRFTGGEAPGWDPLAPPARAEAVGLSHISLFRGPQPVNTRAAIMALETFRAADSRGFEAFLERSNEAAAQTARAVSAGNWAAFRRAVELAAANSQHLGDLIGVPSVPPEDVVRWAQSRGGVAKCVGAGNELTAVILPPASETEIPDGVVSVRIAMPEGNA